MIDFIINLFRHSPTWQESYSVRTIVRNVEHIDVDSEHSIKTTLMTKLTIRLYETGNNNDNNTS